MKGLLGRVSARLGIRGAPAGQDDTASQLAQYDVLEQAIHNCMRQLGLSRTWLRGDIVWLSQDSGKPRPHLLLTILEWDEDITRSLPLLQNRLLLAMNAMDSATDHRNWPVSWQFDPACGYPYKDLSDSSGRGHAPDFTDVRKAREAAAQEVPRFDLPERDSREWEAMPSNFLHTVPSMLPEGDTPPPPARPAAKADSKPTAPGHFPPTEPGPFR